MKLSFLSVQIRPVFVFLALGAILLIVFNISWSLEQKKEVPARLNFVWRLNKQFETNPMSVSINNIPIRLKVRGELRDVLFMENPHYSLNNSAQENRAFQRVHGAEMQILGFKELILSNGYQSWKFPVE